ncbi:MAG: hypothetical protein DMF90_19165 [Acidobacteria bacterium]|nr:MAG: hypothetical protein DMF90_19165 [Acidobacteriota bacterium]
MVWISVVLVGWLGRGYPHTQTTDNPNWNGPRPAQAITVAPASEHLRDLSTSAPCSSTLGPALECDPGRDRQLRRLPIRDLIILRTRPLLI